MRIGESGPKTGAVNGLDAEFGAKRAAKHVEHAGDELVDVDTRGSERLPAREGQQPMGELRGTRCAL